MELQTEQRIAELEVELASREQRISELERRLRIPFGKFPCAQCGGPHNFDTSVPSVIWNRIIRAKGLPEYLCVTCIVREFAIAGESFTAQLWNEEFNGASVEFVINGRNAQDAAAIQDENNRLRNELAVLRKANEEVMNAERENAARLCEDLVTFTEDHNGTGNCSWCEALEKAAADIRSGKREFSARSRQSD